MEQKLLQILQRCRSLSELKETHCQILSHGLQERYQVLPKLVDAASTLHSLNYAVQIFGLARNPNVVAFNTLTKCFIEKGCGDEAFSTYSQMRASGVSPNNYTFTFLLKACESLESQEGSRQVHAQVVKCGFGFTVFVQNTLLNVYSRCCLELCPARQVFDEMPERDVVSWNSMIGAYIVRGDMTQAMHLFEVMPERSVVSSNSVIAGLSKVGDMDLAQRIFDQMTTRVTISCNAMISGYMMRRDVAAAQTVFDQMEDKDVVSWTAMISGYTKTGDLGSARKLFEQMPVKNVVSWNAMIGGYNQNRQFDQALHLFQRMLLDGRFQPDEATLVGIVSACAHLGSVENGNWVHSYVKKNNFHLTTTLGNALVDMFAKCGDTRRSLSVFNQMSKKCIITWTSIISGLAYNGHCIEALALFDTMCRERIEPDDVFFIAVLSACIHGGLVEEGLQIFNLMVKQYGIKLRIEHYGCVVDLLGRAGQLESAFQFIESMPVEPNVVIWATVLSSCTIHGAWELAEFASKKIVDLNSLDPGYQVLVSNSRARGQKWVGVADARTKMWREGIEKVPGCSLIQVGSEINEFLVMDARHERRKEIYKALDDLTRLMRQEGYIPSRNPHSPLNENNKSFLRLD